MSDSLDQIDATSNRKARPNENFARELLELFCLGPGSYTEEDIRQIARTFTGSEVHRDRFQFNGNPIIDQTYTPLPILRT